MSRLPGKRVVTATAVMAALVLLIIGFLFRHRLAEEYWLWELRSQPVERKLLAARRLGESRSVHAVPALIREFRTIVGTAEVQDLHNHAYKVFQEALVQIGPASLPELVRTLSPKDFEDPVVYTFLQDTIQILYLSIPHRDPGYGEGISYDIEVLKNAIRKMREDPLAAIELREAAACALEKNSSHFRDSEDQEPGPDPDQDTLTSPGKEADRGAE